MTLKPDSSPSSAIPIRYSTLPKCNEAFSGVTLSSSVTSSNYSRISTLPRGHQTFDAVSLSSSVTSGRCKIRKSSSQRRSTFLYAAYRKCKCTGCSKRLPLSITAVMSVVRKSCMPWNGLQVGLSPLSNAHLFFLYNPPRVFTKSACGPFHVISRVSYCCHYCCDRGNF